MLLTVFLAIIVCAAITLMLISAVAFVQNEKFFSSAPKEARDIIQPRKKEVFPGARVFGWVLMLFSLLMILGVIVIGAWDGVKNHFTFLQFFTRSLVILTVYKLYDMTFCSVRKRKKRSMWQRHWKSMSKVL